MSRVKRGVIHSKARRTLLKKTKGMMWGRKSKVRLAHTAALKAGSYAYRDRRTKKRLRRGLWQIKINAAARSHDTTYSKLIGLLASKSVTLDRKILSTLAQDYPEIFAKIVSAVT